MIKKLFFFLFTIFMSVNMMANAYVKVTAAPASWNGHYLIVYEGDNTHASVAFDGSLETLDAVNNGVVVTIVSDSIVATEALKASEFIIAGDTLKSKSGYEIGKTANSNGLDANKTKHYSNTFTMDGTNVTITSSGGPTLKYNYAKDQLRFRYYKSGQQKIALYKFNGSVEPEPVVPPTPYTPLDTITCDSASIAALALPNKTTGDSALVKGYVTAIETEWSSTYLNISFWMADTENGGQVFEGYRVVCETEEEAPNVGDLIWLKGILKNYNSTPETDAGATFGILKRKPSTPTGITNVEDKAKAIKRFKDGQILIERNDGTYTVMGARVK